MLKKLPGRQFPQVNPRWLCSHTTVLKSCPWCWPFLPKVLQLQMVRWPGLGSLFQPSVRDISPLPGFLGDGGSELFQHPHRPRLGAASRPAKRRPTSAELVQQSVSAYSLNDATKPESGGKVLGFLVAFQVSVTQPACSSLSHRKLAIEGNLKVIIIKFSLSANKFYSDFYTDYLPFTLLSDGNFSSYLSPSWVLFVTPKCSYLLNWGWETQ